MNGSCRRILFPCGTPCRVASVWSQLNTCETLHGAYGWVCVWTCTSLLTKLVQLVCLVIFFYQHYPVYLASCNCKRFMLMFLDATWCYCMNTSISSINYIWLHRLLHLLNLELWKGERSSRSLFFEQLTAQRLAALRDDPATPTIYAATPHCNPSDASREALHSQPGAATSVWESLQSVFGHEHIDAAGRCNDGAISIDITWSFLVRPEAQIAGER